MSAVPTGELVSICGVCRKPLPVTADECKACGAVYSLETVERVRGAGLRGAHGHWSTQPRAEDGTFLPIGLPSGAERLYEVEAEQVERMELGDPAIDLVTGGGLARGFAYAIHGPGGIGKSRVCLRAAALACAFGPSVYAVAKDEEGKDMVKLYAQHAGYFRNSDVQRNLITIVEDDPEALAWKIQAVAPVFVVVDAVSALDDVALGCRVLREMAHASRLDHASEAMTVLEIFHETGEGKMKGGSELQYLVDAILDMDGVAKTKKGKWKKLCAEEPSTFSWLRSRKNRFAQKGAYAVMELTDTSYEVIEMRDGKGQRLDREEEEIEIDENDPRVELAGLLKS